MSVAKSELIKLTEKACLVFHTLDDLQFSTSIGTSASLSPDTGLNVNELAAAAVSNLAHVVELVDSMRGSITDELVYFIGDAIDKSDIERPAAIPIKYVCCLEFSIPLAIKVFSDFESALWDKYAIRLRGETWPDAKLLYQLAEQLKTGDDDLPMQILDALNDAISAGGTSLGNFSMLEGLAKREGIRAASLIAGDDDPADYPWDAVLDSIIWENIRDGKRAVEILMENHKKGSAVDSKRMKQRALQWAVFHKYKNTRNFTGERVIEDSERERVLSQIASMQRRKR